MTATAWYALGMAGVGAARGRWGLAAAVGGLSVWLEPVLSTLNLGQVNAIVMLLVLADLAQPDRRRWKGVGVGLATGIKLVPGLFIVYLLLTRRLRAAAVSAGTFAATVLLGLALSPRDFADYWGGAFADPHRVASAVGIGYLGNQSLHGLAARLTGGDGTALWLPLALVTLVAGTALGVLVQRRGRELPAVLVIAFTGLLVSPVAWTHHWVWVVPLLIFAFTAAARLRGPRQLLAQAGAVTLAGVYLAWPFWHDRTPLVPLGLTWLTTGHLGTGVPGAVVHELDTIAALAFLLGVAGWLWRTRSPEPVPPAPARRAWDTDGDRALRTVTVPRQKTGPEAIDPTPADSTLA
jgi:alpha-1,2-mannosyltransferase